MLLLLLGTGLVWGGAQEQRFARLLEQYPEADANGDGRLTAEEARAYRQKLQGRTAVDRSGTGQGAPRQFQVDPGWDADRFPEHAVCYRTPQEIEAIYAKTLRDNERAVTSYPKPANGARRIVGTGHSFMGPGYQTFPLICRAAGFEQPLLTHTGGGITGSARYKWEQENGIFAFDGNPKPKLLASLANAPWDAMMWGPYFNDRPAYYACWIDFCLKYHPHMKFYLSDAWPQLEQLDEIPSSEDALNAETFVRLGKERNAQTAELIGALNKKYPGKVFVMPTSDAMVLAAQHYYRRELPGVEGIHRAVGNKERSLWRDRLGHLGPGFDRLEGYVFYATIYARSPELIEGDIPFGGSSDFPGRKLDRLFRKIAWQAVVHNCLSGVTDQDHDGIGDRPPAQEQFGGSRYATGDDQRVTHRSDSRSLPMEQPSGALVPTLVSDWFRIVEYPENHLNDFCLFRDQSGLWHAIGIMGTGEAKSEVRFFHSTGESLRRRFTNREPLFEGLPDWIGARRSSNLSLRKHAPFVVYHDNEYHMFYRRPNGTNLHVCTRDPRRWPNRVELAFEEQDARDSCIIRMGEVFYHYSCQAMEIDGIWRSCVAVRTSRDLREWSAAEPAHLDTSHVTDHSRMESPFVVQRPEGYYLFVRNRMFDYPSLTTIYFSHTPQRFPSGNQAWFAELENVHAPEIVEEAGRYFIARVSGPRHANRQAPAQGGGWIEVAELAFRPHSSQN